MTADAIGGAILLKSTHWYCEVYFCPLLHDPMRRSIINAEVGGATKRNNIVSPTDEPTKPTRTIINKPATIKRIGSVVGVIPRITPITHRYAPALAKHDRVQRLDAHLQIRLESSNCNRETCVRTSA